MGTDQLETFVREIFVAAGTPPGPAADVAEHLVSANLVGHDSHGVNRAPGYIRLVETGHIVPDAPIEVYDETDTTAVVDANWGLGFSATNHATDLATAKAHAHGTGAVTIRRQSHMGRLGWYSARAAERGVISFVVADSGRAPKVVAPLGGRARRLGTNPLSFGVPSELDGPLVLDMATSAVAQGKTRIAKARGELLPYPCIVAADGSLTRDPHALGEDDGGALLPFGGDQVHKGYGLSFMVEVFAGLLTGIGFSHDPGGFSNDGAFVAAFAVDRFRPLEEFTRDVRAFVDYLKDTPLADGHDEILYPGEVEARTAARRRDQGIDIDDPTWQRLVDVARRYAVEVPAAFDGH
ncbi:Ldh family oxidoreductase [Phytoactinopolyspora halophila]|uniref:Ldh family oxidoreductase n=1 Tax=Phytoactinopolyspora halophila TaxID=1981511 RepID=UPI001313FE69|nr:Ldh family oxidoreductase [Phytoactinopolyspora halophila]